MVKSKLEEEFNAKVLASVQKTAITFVNPRKKANFSTTKDGKIRDVLKQRHNQRAILFWFSLSFVLITTTIVFILIIIQAIFNTNPESKVKLIDDRTLQIVVTGIFVQFVGLVGIITRSIWNDKPYLDAGVMKTKK